MTPTAVAGFILLDPGFPRSVTHCVNEIRETLDTLLSREEFSGISFDRANLAELEGLCEHSPESIIAFGLNDYLDQVQVALIALGKQISTEFLMAHYTD